MPLSFELIRLYRFDSLARRTWLCGGANKLPIHSSGARGLDRIAHPHLPEATPRPVVRRKPLFERTTRRGSNR
jgi:hypothetical protein